VYRRIKDQQLKSRQKGDKRKIRKNRKKGERKIFQVLD
jgi:hypothetical protein